jgi:uncharacterized RDD family membrane protein YckC
MALPATTFQSCPNHPEVNSGLVPCARCGVAYCGDCLVELEGRPYDAACKEEQVRDLRSGTSAPVLATAGRRFGGIFVDSLLFVPLWVGLGIAYPQAGLFDHPLPRMVLPGVLIVLYEAWMLTKFGGQTLGKKAAGIRVTRPDGSAIDARQAFWRALSRNLMSFTYVLGIVDALMIFSGGRRTLHDRAGGTIVVNARP